jgi:nucleotide-binding universal stress UspA family protein
MKMVVAIHDTSLGAQVLAVIGGWAAQSGVEVDVLCALDPNQVRETVASKAAHALTPAATMSGTNIGVHEPTASMVETRTQAIERARVEIQDRMRKLANSHLQGATHRVDVRFDQRPAEAIVRYATELDADVIAIGTHGRGGIRQALFGSVPGDVVRTAPMPVLLIREDMGIPPASR